MNERWFPDAMPNPAVTPGTRPFFEAARDHRLVLQRCTACRRFRHPPRPICPHCGSFDFSWEEIEGKGALFTWAVVHQPFLPSLRDVVPYVVAVVELDGTGGTRMASNIVDTPLDALSLGLPVEVAWEEMSAELTLPRFRAAR